MELPYDREQTDRDVEDGDAPAPQSDVLERENLIPVAPTIDYPWYPDVSGDFVN
jgi:hypothetical protein